MSVWSNFSDSSLLEVFDSVLSKCDASYCCCGCCAALRPRYKRLVDNIFPVYPEDGLVRNNMDKLTFYSMSSPEKLDRIGEYLAQRVSRDIYRHRNLMVNIAMEAMDLLLGACHAHARLNLFVESFLKTVQQLLETTDPELQVLASESFVKFANIEEDTPSYHRRYDFFVSKFASLSHSNHKEVDIMNSLRVAGLRGIQGVVRKTVSDDLVENIWEPTHMDKIVPALLFNMQCGSYETNTPGHPEADSESNSRKIDPATLAEHCLRELLGKASYGNIKSVIKPVFEHLDIHELWVPNEFAVYTFRVIMCSIQVQYSYTVVENLMKHMEISNRSKAIVRTSMANVLGKIISIAAGESVGPSVLEIVDCLVRQLKESVMQENPAESSLVMADEKLFQAALIGALAEFAYHLPDYQKIEIMMFILGRSPGIAKVSHENKPGETFIQHMLLKCLLEVGSKYRTTNYSTALPLNFLEPLLRTALSKDADARILVQEILQCMLDRHDNRAKLTTPSVSEVIEMSINHVEFSRSDAMFYKNHGSRILANLYESLELGNLKLNNVKSVYCTAAILCIELPTDDMLIDVIRWALAVQEIALSNTNMETPQRSLLHIVALSIVALVSRTTNVSHLLEYAMEVVEARKQHARHLLEVDVNVVQVDKNIPPACLLEHSAISERVQGAGKDMPGMIPVEGAYSAHQRHSWGDSSLNQQPSSDELSNMNNEGGDSNSSSPGLPRRQIEEVITFEALKKVLAEPAESRREAEVEKRQMICEKFQNTPFLKLVESSQSKGDVLSDTLNQILTNISVLPCQPEGNSNQSNQALPLYGNNFPDLFVY